MNIIQIAFLNFGYFQQFQMSYILSTYPTHIDYILSHYRWDYEYHVLYMYIYTRTEYYSQSKKIFRQWMENCIRGTGLLCGKVETVALNINLLFFYLFFALFDFYLPLISNGIVITLLIFCTRLKIKIDVICSEYYLWETRFYKIYTQCYYELTFTISNKFFLLNSDTFQSFRF